MNASHVSESLLRRAIDFLLGRRPPRAVRQAPAAMRPEGARANSVPPTATAAEAVVRAPVPVAVAAGSPPALPQPAARVAPTVAQGEAAPRKPQRTIEEVRADLARLRESARLRHAQMQARLGSAFAPTDFMDFAPALPPAPATPVPAFAPTDFLDFGGADMAPRKP